jgi:pimeloyl-ACP methyl ester carboxylesterase
VLYPIFALMIAGGTGAVYETVREAQDRSTYAMPGELVDVGGHRLHIDCTGQGSPTVVLEAGLGGSSPIMAGWIAPAVAPATRVCVYDRAGKGWSDPAPAGQDGLAVVDDLHTLLERHGETGPFVIAGHSSGGVYAQAFAATYPDEVAGLVLLDSQPATALTRLPGYDQMYSWLRRAGGVGPSASRFGLMRLVIGATAGSLPEPRRGEEDAFESTADQARSTRDELEALPAAMERARTLTSLGDKPVAVVTAEKEAQEGWLPLQDEMATLSTDSVHRVIHDATHTSLVEDETDARESSRAILDVVRSVRFHTPLSSSARLVTVEEMLP